MACNRLQSIDDQQLTCDVLPVQDYLFTYKRGIEGVTTQDVLEAAQRHLHPPEQLVVVAADARLAKPQLEARDKIVVLLSLD